MDLLLKAAYRHVSKGDSDLTTAYTLWDFKVSKAKVKRVHPATTYVLADACIRFILSFKASNHPGIYNPRLNQVL